MQRIAQFQRSSGPLWIIMILNVLFGLLFLIFACYKLVAVDKNVNAKVISSENVNFNDLLVGLKKGR